MRWKWWSVAVGWSSARRLAEAPEAWLRGGYLPWLLSRRRVVPTWAWINPAAHLERGALEQLAASRPGAANGWGLTCYLAGELIAAADRDGVDVRVLQHDRLVPLELELLRREGTDRAPRRAELASMVVAALGAPAHS